MAFYRTDDRMATIGTRLRSAALERFRAHGLTEGALAFTWLVYDRPLRGGFPPSAATFWAAAPRGIGHRGDAPYYPCSVVKVFYLVAAHAALEAGRLRATGELERAMRDMIVSSSNTGTNYVIDHLTGTTGDTELPAGEFAEWREKRHAVNRYFQSYGWPELATANACQKLMDDDRYGREKQFVGADGANHNRLTTDATARLFHALVGGAIVTPARCQAMMETLARPLDPGRFLGDPHNQVTGFLGGGLPSGSRLWSKAGLTSWTGDAAASWRRHDAAYVELPSGRAFVLAAFTEGLEISQRTDWLPFLGATAVDLVDEEDR